MGIDKLISIAAALAVLTVSTGQIPKALHAVRAAELQLIHDSRASAWGRPLLLLPKNGPSDAFNSAQESGLHRQ